MPDLKIIGRQPVLEALEARLPLKRIFLTPKPSGDIAEKIIQLAEKAGIPQRVLKKIDLENMAGSRNHQGFVAVMAELPVLGLEQLLQQVSTQSAPALVVLDGIEDPRNLGAILRVVDGAGLQGVIVPGRRSAGLTPGAIKASAGAAFHVPVAEVTNLARAMEVLKKHKFWLVGADMQGGVPPWQLDLKIPVAFVLGQEGKGLHRLVREKCDFIATLPMYGKIASLNVATTAAVLFYEMVRQRAKV